MQPYDSTNRTNPVLQTLAYLQRQPVVHSLVYLGGTAITAEVVWRIFHPTGPYELVRFQLATLPFVAAWTYTCARWRPGGRSTWYHRPSRRDATQLVLGLGLGAGTALLWTSLAAAKGWISAPAWGWEHTSVHIVLRSLAILAAGHFAVAWNEEQVFRGYGFDTLRAAFGPMVASGVLIPLFALAHGTSLMVLVGEAALGTTLTLLRLLSGGLALPIGYHWGCNYLEIAIFGARDAEPSLRPLDVHGPYHWIGRPGYPEPGWLAILVQCGIVALLAIVWWRRKRAYSK